MELEGNRSSSPKNITGRVPQGLILGPTHFIICINDLLAAISVADEECLYANDTSVVLGVDDMLTINVNTQVLTANVKRWLYYNDLKLNKAKPQRLTFLDNKNKNVSQQSVKFYDFNMETTHCWFMQKTNYSYFYYQEN